MNTVFIGGSRHVLRLPAEVKKRLDNVIASGHRVVVGDANGVDKAVQKHLMDANYEKVTVYCSGSTPRNNVGSWATHPVSAPKGVKGFQFYAAKDREMARDADFGLMIWDGQSSGTMLNVLRLIRAGKISVVFNVPKKTSINIKSVEQWESFLSECSPELRSDLERRATPEEWSGNDDEVQASLLDGTGASRSSPTMMAGAVPADEGLKELNHALAVGDAAAVMNVLGGIARERGMTKIARETGLARESLYRSLDSEGNPEFTTVVKVLSSIGIHLEAKRATKT